MATSDDVVPPHSARERPAKGTNRVACLAGVLLGEAWAVQIPYYRLVPGGSTMSR